MSDKTDDLRRNLLSDLSVYLDDYQLALSAAGGDLWPDASIQQAQCHALVGSILKKYNEDSDPSPAATAVALEKFLLSNERCKTWELRLENSSDEVLFGMVKSQLYDFWNKNGYELIYTYDELFRHGSLGRGMNVRARGDDWYTKLFDSPLSCTTGSLAYIWQKLCSRDNRWDDAERLRHSRYGTCIVAGNSLSFVNKNVHTARSICTEPTINMWFQLGMGSVLEERLSEFFGIDIRHQAVTNGILARTGSIDGRFATIDLESASDSVSLRMLSEILPAGMLAWLVRLRSPSVRLPDGKEEELHMVSSMGNGFTFPLQTAIFCSVVAAVYASRGYSLKRYGPSGDRNFGVFGDDIIVLRELAPLVIRVLGMLGFRVNQSKTFLEGPFRESCGQDWFNGHWCRGVYIKRLKTTQDAYVAINALNLWSARTGILLPRTVQYLVKWCHNPLYVPPDESDDAGIQVPFDKALGVRRLQHGIVEYKYSAVRPLSLEIKYAPDEGSPQSVEGPSMRGGGVRKRGVNELGLHLCFLHGSVKGYRISLRQRHVRYTTKRRVTSSWDNLLPVSRYTYTGWSRWSDAVRYNLP